MHQDIVQEGKRNMFGHAIKLIKCTSRVAIELGNVNVKDPLSPCKPEERRRFSGLFSFISIMSNLSSSGSTSHKCKKDKLNRSKHSSRDRIQSSFTAVSVHGTSTDTAVNDDRIQSSFTAVSVEVP